MQGEHQNVFLNWFYGARACVQKYISVPWGDAVQLLHDIMLIWREYACPVVVRDYQARSGGCNPIRRPEGPLFRRETGTINNGSCIIWPHALGSDINLSVP